MAKKLRDIAVGNTIKLPESGVLVDFYVAKHDYEPDLNGTGRTLMVRKDGYKSGDFGTSGSKNTYADNIMDTWHNSTYKQMLSAKVQELIGTTTFYYTPGGGTSSTYIKVTTLSRSVFQLSVTELGGTKSDVNVEGSALPIAATLQTCYQNGTTNTKPQWTRTPSTINATAAFSMLKTGSAYVEYDLTTNNLYRPAFTLPADTFISDTGEIVFNDPPTVPTGLAYDDPKAGKQMGVTWNASTDPDGDAITYTVEYSIDGGAYIQAGQTTGRSLPVVVPTSGATVRVRVKATDSNGNESEYATGSALAISHNTAPVISGTNTHLGKLTEAPDYAYIVTDPDTDQVLTVTEKVTLPNGKTHELRTFKATSGREYRVKWNCHCWLCCLPGTNTLTITVTDGVESATRRLTFTKANDCISAARAVATDAMASRVLLSLYPVPAVLPADCTIEAQVTNNPFDDNPVWENVSVRLNRVVHTFANTTCKNGYGVGYRFCIRKGASGETVTFDSAVIRFA